MSKKHMKMPDFLVYAKAMLAGWLLTEVFCSAFYLSDKWALSLQSYSLCVHALMFGAGVLLCGLYIWQRGGFSGALRMVRSRRVDLGIIFGAGCGINLFGVNEFLMDKWQGNFLQVATQLPVKTEETVFWLDKWHAVLLKAEPEWAQVVLAILCMVLGSSLVHRFLNFRKASTSDKYLSDEAIGDASEDVLSVDSQAKTFAETVLSVGTQAGHIFGVDGPWGSGKSSFINLAQKYWEKHTEKPIVCRFEPLRYAAETDLAERMLRKLMDDIQREAYVPEFRSAASRYARLLGGKIGVSFLGFKLSLNPANESVDNVLESINEVLTRNGRRVIFVIDDLDRLDPKTINSVLFATRRTLALEQVSFVICYDTEVLIGNAAGKNEEGVKAREFLEKFVNIKISLFVESQKISDFLRRDWQTNNSMLNNIPSITMLKLGDILGEVASILESDQAAHYVTLLGDMRKVKRFVNALLGMEFEGTDLSQTDFNKRDLIHLVLLHLNYPGLFRRIYAEETSGRSGVFSEKTLMDTKIYQNSSRFPDLIASYQEIPRFLLMQLFDMNSVARRSIKNSDENQIATRACFNLSHSRNLEKYLRRIVRLVTPERQTTYIFNIITVQDVMDGVSIQAVLQRPEFNLKDSAEVQMKFWTALVRKSPCFTKTVAASAIDTLVDLLPSYSVIPAKGRVFRDHEIYNLLELLNKVGWGSPDGERLTTDAKYVIEVAWRILGKEMYINRGLIQHLCHEDRGILGWYDLMQFRYNCSRENNTYYSEISKGLYANHDINVPLSYQVDEFAFEQMREISQVVFMHFKRIFIDVDVNFFEVAYKTTSADFLGITDLQTDPVRSKQEIATSLLFVTSADIDSKRNHIIQFVISQLCNAKRPNNAGVGCGVYDVQGNADACGIDKLMAEYILGFCFKPNVKDIGNINIIYFLDFCLNNITKLMFVEQGSQQYKAYSDTIGGGLDFGALGHYWLQNRELIIEKSNYMPERSIIRSGVSLSYAQYLPDVFRALDELADPIPASSI